MKTNKEVVLEVITAFDNNDIQGVLKNATSDIQWVMLGDQTLSGKVGITSYFDYNKEIKLTSSTMHTMIVEGDKIAVTGEVEGNGPNGGTFNMDYCDIYELHDGKVQKIISYTVDKKKK